MSESLAVCPSSPAVPIATVLVKTHFVRDLKHSAMASKSAASLRLSEALASGLLPLPFEAVVPGVTLGDPDLHTLIQRLHEARAARRTSSVFLSALDAVTVPLAIFSRKYDVEHGCGESPPSSPTIVTSDLTDFLLLDVTPESYVSIGSELGVSRWSTPAVMPSTFPVEGTLWGPNKRVMLPLECHVGAYPSVVLHMLLDTGAPGTLLCAATMEKLGLTDVVPRSAKVVLHGCPLSVNLSHSHFVDNDVLGADWLSAARARVAIDYAELRVVVEGSVSGAAGVPAGCGAAKAAHVAAASVGSAASGGT